MKIVQISNKKTFAQWCTQIFAWFCTALVCIACSAIFAAVTWKIVKWGFGF